MPGAPKKSSKQKAKSETVVGSPSNEVKPKLKAVLETITSDSPGSEDGSEDGSEEEDVDEEGMKRLMKALGDDGLDDIGKMQLEVLAGEDGEGDTGSEDGDSTDGSEDGKEVDEESGGEDAEVKDQKEAEDSENKEDVDDLEENAIVVDVGEEVALEDAESVDEDAIPRQKVTVDNKVALDRILDTIKLDPKLPWTETLVVTYPETIDVDVEDDLNRELAFYKQALHGAHAARKLANQHNLPFTRPSDYFAEMVKSDAHMERIRQRLLDENAANKKSEDKRREREGKKFGKQVQIEKLKERERSKKDMEERLKALKRKRKDGVDLPQADDDGFDVDVEEAIDGRPNKKSKAGGSKLSRPKRDAKFGFGGKGRRSKQNTKESTEKFDYGSRKGKGGKGGNAAKPRRLGKSRRMASRG